MGDNWKQIAKMVCAAPDWPHAIVPGQPTGYVRADLYSKWLWQRGTSEVVASIARNLHG